MSNFRRNTLSTLLAFLAVVIVFLGAGRGDTLSDVRMATGRYQQDLLVWHINHFMDKWMHLAFRPVTGALSAEDKAQAVEEFFQLGEDLRRMRSDLERTLALTEDARTVSPEQVQAAIDVLDARRAELQPVVLETLESALSRALDEMDIIDRIGPIHWPPVNFTFVPGSLVLVRSPRDAITRLEDTVLRADITLLDQVALEEAVEEDARTAALVVRVGGMATYPAQVSPDHPLHTTLFLAAHEWTHHWLFFRPLGKRWWDGGEMTSINETVADMVGEEAGDRAFEILTGQTIQREPWVPPALRPPREPQPDVFDFTHEMRQTRVRLEELLAAGLVEEAEAYLEERRLLFVANRYNIRKLNTAWFAFHGTYGGSPGAISPIEVQLRTIRADSDSLAEFLDRVSLITRPGQLEAMARDAGWTPGTTSIPTSTPTSTQ